MAQGDLPTPRGGSLQRRREKRQLEQLAQATRRAAVAPKVVTAHVRVIEDQGDAVVEDHADVTDLDVETQEPISTIDDVVQKPTHGFHVRAVPIDEPFGK
jgi:signal transduction histidine kinase